DRVLKSDVLLSDAEIIENFKQLRLGAASAAVDVSILQKLVTQYRAKPLASLLVGIALVALLRAKVEGPMTREISDSLQLMLRELAMRSVRNFHVEILTRYLPQPAMPIPYGLTTPFAARLARFAELVRDGGEIGELRSRLDRLLDAL